MAPTARTTRHIFVTGGVASSLGKGLTASSLGNLLTARGLRVVMQKLDPYLNVDPGTMNPFQHGEVFVTEDGAETDLDIGHYERFLDVELPASSNVTTGQVYSRVIAGTRASLMVGLFTTIGVVIIGGIIGALAGYFGGWIDGVLARLGDIFFALPLILGALVVMQLPYFKAHRGVWTLVLVLVLFGWPQIARIMRGAVVEVRNADYVVSARSLGVSSIGILLRHIIPNAMAPVIVIATISLGTFIVAESTLSYLGIGLPPSMMSWGNDISDAKDAFRSNPMPVFWPGLALSLTVLSFIMLGDALRDALDPKARKK